MQSTSSAGSAPATALQWDTLVPGFADPVHDSQAVFRVLLEALAHPTRVFDIGLDLDVGETAAAPAALAALYAMSDFATPLWLLPDNPVLAGVLRFHTGAPLAAKPAEAAFAWIDQALAVPPLREFCQGSAESPETSTTLFIRVDDLTGGTPLVCRGPGIENVASMAPRGLPAGFWATRAALAGDFPCGVDLYLVCGTQLLGVPRTTRVEEA